LVKPFPVVRSGFIWWRVLAVAWFCGLFLTAPARALGQQPAASQSSENHSTGGSSQPPPSAQPPSSSPASKAPTSVEKAAGHQKPRAKKAPAISAKGRTVSSKKRKSRTLSPRVRRMRQAFVASTTLRPMAQQLFQDRSPAAYAGVEAYARAHSKEDAGALAWLVAGYAHVLDREFAKAIDPLNRAKPQAGDLGDYVAYYLGTSSLQTGRTAEAVAALTNFSTVYPESLLSRDAQVTYGSALLLEGRAAEAVALLEKKRTPVRADMELALGRAYAAAGENGKAVEALGNVYYNMPTSPEAETAYSELRKLGAGGALPGAIWTERKTRADLLMKGRRYNDAATEYRDLLNQVSAADRPPIELAMADAVYRGGRGREAKPVLLAMASLSGDANAQRLFILGEIARGSDDNNGFYDTVDELRKSAPASSWLEQSLLSAANLHLVHHEYDQAIDLYQELQQRFPQGPRASYAHWKAAWFTLRQGHNENAKTQFEEQIARYPSGPEIPAALYWRARLAEEDNDPVMARAYYEKLSERYRNYYYAELGRQRLERMPQPADPQHYALLDRVPPLDSGGKVTASEPPADDLRVQKAQLLGNGGLVDFAVRELQAAATADGGSWAPAETAQLYLANGHYDRGIQVMKRSAPSYFSLDIPDLPRPYWEALFPKAYWAELKRFSTGNGLDPYLVASLIRQESEFNPYAVSQKNAVGLMQLLPKTGKLVAKQAKLKKYNASQLFTPAVNLQLGTRYFRGMVDRFGGSLEYALAAYNAGSERVDEWLGQGKYRDPQEFVESIPFTETREYVQAILRNANVYKQLYGAP